ncbi:threonine aldolase family protein [Nocardia brasiliensis]
MPGNDVIDLMSDSRTTPSRAMRAAMARARVGDDSFGDDPTVDELERRLAVSAGKEAALFTCGGTMSNLLAVLSRPVAAGPVIAGQESHVGFHEAEGLRTIARVDLVPIADQPFGVMCVAELAQTLRSLDTGSLVCLENTSTRLGGSALDRAAIKELADIAHAAGSTVHLDGARLPNAAAALGVSMAELAGPADTVAIALDKGLGAPIGSALCGDERRIARARELRRMVGGTMHQTGVVAAAGLIALENLSRLVADHRRAALLRQHLARVGSLEVAEVPVPTNLVMVRQVGVRATDLLRKFASTGVLGLPLTGDWVRFVVHMEHDDRAVREAASRCARAVSARAW